MTFVTPWALLFALSALVPLAAFAALERRARGLRRAVGEPQPGALPSLPVVLSLAVVPVLLALAVAQPVVERRKTRVDRSDVEGYVVLDTSGSMQAAPGHGAPTRLERAKSEALALRRSLADVRFGIASMTDRTLPHLFPSGDPDVFEATLAESVGIERPPPSIASVRATSLQSLASLARRGFFTAPGKLVVVFTDGESEPVSGEFGIALHKAAIRPLFVHVWRPDEQIYIGGVPDPNYRPERASAAMLARAAALTDGRVLQEGNVGALLAAARRLLSGGVRTETVRTQDLRLVPLAKWFVLGAALPLAFLLWHRNATLGFAVRRPSRHLADER